MFKDHSMTSTLISIEAPTAAPLPRLDMKRATFDDIFHYVFLFLRHVLMSLMVLAMCLWLMVTVVAISEI